MDATVPMDPETPAPPARGQPPDERRCTAHSKQSKERCKRWAAAGQRTCYYHGAATGAAKRKAALRMADMADPAFRVLHETLNDYSQKRSDMLRAMENFLDRGGYPRRAELDVDAGRAGLLERLRALDDTPDT